MGTALFAVGLIVALIGGIWIIVNAFKKSVLWGLGSLFVPFVSLVFVIMNWQENKKPFLISIAGAVLYGIGAYMSIGDLQQMQQLPPQ
jgi:hypothetical protein